MSLGKPKRALGILREVKNKWERRVAITPTEVQKLLTSTNNDLRVLVQPCERRVFKDIEYENAGAILTNDLSDASCIIGVKEFSPTKLLPDHSYLLFSHVIKAQEQNLPFLDTCLAKNIRLFDYECIREPPNPNSTVPPLRLVAFGKFAGLAGMITGLRGLGEHLLAQGSATPFLNISSAYMYESLENSKHAMSTVGDMISKYGLPTRFGPFTFCFTGGGNVTQGALEMFKLLPHEFVEYQDLQQLQHNFSPHKVYGCILPTAALVSPFSQKSNQPFVEQHYFDFPEEYHPVFHSEIAPYTSVLVNGMYWDHRYPRLLTCKQTAELKANFPNSMLALFDISCDIEGSVEFLRKSTTTDLPYFLYNPFLDRVSDDIDGDGILVLGVDALPAELPRESSEYFSNALYPFLQALAVSDAPVSFEELSNHLPPEMHNACITSNNELTPNFRYIDTLRKNKQSSASASVSSSFGEQKHASHALLRIDGHLFDSGLINQIFDLIELEHGEYHILHLQSRVNTGGLTRASRLILQIDVHHDRLQPLVDKLHNLVVLTPKSQATVTELPFGATHHWSAKKGSREDVEDDASKYSNQDSSVVRDGGYAKLSSSMKPTLKKIIDNANRTGAEKKVLILGSGYVSKPVIDYLCYSGNNVITVASNDIDSAVNLCSHHPYANGIAFDANDLSGIDSLVQSHDIIVSLLPATMHVPIAESCIRNHTHLVTASYISPPMSELNDRAAEAGVVLLNEVGLDPGLDHMSALKIIREIQQPSADADVDAEYVSSFSSVCGGLPAPECANNLLGYKFSWSPMGVLRASLNSSTYLSNKSVVTIDGNDLLNNSRQLYPNPYPSLSLEEIPNRNSLEYIVPYGLNADHLHTMYRGTLRYSGFCQLLYACKLIGLMDNELPFPNFENEEWGAYLKRLIEFKFEIDLNAENSNLQLMIERILMRTSDLKGREIQHFLDLLHWLDIMNEGGEDDSSREKHAILSANANHTPMDIFCELLENKLSYSEHERDMVLMYHRIGTNKHKMYESSLLVYGDDEYSAMARTVGFPVAIAAQTLLNYTRDGTENENEEGIAYGVISGGNESISESILEGCKCLGIRFREQVTIDHKTLAMHKK